MTNVKLIKSFLLGSVLLCNSVFALEYTIYVTGNAAAGSTYTQGNSIDGQCVGTPSTKHLVITCTSDGTGNINVFGTINVSTSCHYTIGVLNAKGNGIIGSCAGIVQTNDIPPIPNPGNAKWKIELNSSASANLNTPK